MQCDYQVLHFNTLDETFTCDAKLLNVNTSTRIGGVSKEYFEYEVELEAVKYLRILYERIGFVPKGIENFFPNLLGLRISNANIKYLTKRDLQPFRQLELLSFDGNQIETLNSDLFYYTPNLKWIFFDYNKISHVGLGTFDSLVNLRQINLELNACISRDVHGKREIQSLKQEMAKKCPLPRNIQTSRMRNRNYYR